MILSTPGTLPRPHSRTNKRVVYLSRSSSVVRGLEVEHRVPIPRGMEQEDLPEGAKSKHAHENWWSFNFNSQVGKIGHTRKSIDNVDLEAAGSVR